MKSIKPMLAAALVVGSLLACNTTLLAQAGGAPVPHPEPAHPAAVAAVAAARRRLMR